MSEIYPWQQGVWQKLASTRGPRVSEHDPSISHALLLKGRKGLGKLSFASYLAKARLCRNPTEEEAACGSCASCRWFEQGVHPDFRIVQPEALSASSAVTAWSGDTSSEGDRDDGNDGSSEATPGAEAEPGNPKSRKKPSKQISVEQIRALADFINISSHQGGHKIVVIHPAETMNLAAANALLKNLEEPPPRTLFILVAHQSQHLLATIRSRCVQIAMPAPEPSAAVAWLRARGVKDAEMCLASAGYAPLLAIEFDDETYHERHLAFIKHISVPSRLNPISLVEGLQKTDLPTIVNWLQKWCYDLLGFRIAGKIRYHHDQFVAIEALAPTLNPQALVMYLRTLNKTQQLASHPLNERLFLEEILFSYIQALHNPASECV